MTGNVIIVGAPRSGTNILRDVLTKAQGIATWPCDEIPMIWRHGNRDVPHDAFESALATPEVATFIRHEFSKLAKRYKAETIVEKTCATSLRVPFVYRILPDAKYVFIRRDGVDAAVSAANRWHAKFDLRYTARKARYIPPTDLPYYALRGARAVVSRRGATTTGPTFDAEWWGPKPQDWREIGMNHSELEMAFLQWKRCVDSSIAAFDQIPSEQVHQIVYEEFVADPRTTISQLLTFLGHADLMSDDLVGEVSTSSVGKGRKTLDAGQLSRLEELAGDTLRRLGYA